MATSPLEKPEILIEGGGTVALEDEKKYDVCEARRETSSASKNSKKAKQCTRTSCETGNACGAFGQIKRWSRSNVPKVAGNSPGSFCAMSKKYEFIFVHVLKNAGSSTKKWLREATDCPEEKHPCAVEMVDCLEAMMAHPNYFRWTWARHPFNRALSIYAMAKHYELDSSISFADFWLSGEDRWNMTELCSDHAEAQSAFMLDKNGCLAVDYVANLDNATAEWSHILDMIGSPKLKQYEKQVPFMQPADGNVFGRNEAADTGVDNGRELVEQDETLRRYLLKTFDLDFDLLY